MYTNEKRKILELFSAAAGIALAQTSLPESVLDADIRNLNGQSFRLRDGNPKVKVIFLLASWCGPCRFAAKDLNEIYKAYPKSDLDIIGLTNENPEGDYLKVKKFVCKNRIRFKVGWMNAETEKAFTHEKYPGLVPIILILDNKVQVDTKLIGYDFRKTPSKLIEVIKRILNTQDGND